MVEARRAGVRREIGNEAKVDMRLVAISERKISNIMSSTRAISRKDRVNDCTEVDWRDSIMW